MQQSRFADDTGDTQGVSGAGHPATGFTQPLPGGGFITPLGFIEYDEENEKYRVRVWNREFNAYVHTVRTSILDAQRWLAPQLKTGDPIAVTTAINVSYIARLRRRTDEHGVEWISWELVP